MKKRSLILIALSCFVLVMFAGCSALINQSDVNKDSTSHSQTASSLSSKGQEINNVPLHSFTARTFEGENIGPSDFARYDAIAINVWSTTCPPCIKEMPDLARFQKSLPENVLLCTVCLDGKQESNTLKGILDRSSWDGMTIVEFSGDFITLLKKLRYTPTTLFFDGAGNQVGEPLIGAASNVEQTYKSALNKVLHSLGKPALA